MFTTIAALLFAQAATAGTPAPTPSPPCEAEPYRQFDFWIGAWDVFQASDDSHVARSRIERVSHGCAIRETWMPLGGGGGSSLSTYDPQTSTWHQLWVGGQPGRIFFEGGLVDGSMVITGYWGTDSVGVAQLVRMTYTLREDGSVRQYGQASSDHGRTWEDSFDLIYRPQGE